MAEWANHPLGSRDNRCRRHGRLRYTVFDMTHHRRRSAQVGCISKQATRLGAEGLMPSIYLTWVAFDMLCRRKDSSQTRLVWFVFVLLTSRLIIHQESFTAIVNARALNTTVAC